MSGATDLSLTKTNGRGKMTDLVLTDVRLSAAGIPVDERWPLPDGILTGARLQNPVGSQGRFRRLPVRRSQRCRLHLQRSNQSPRCL